MVAAREREKKAEAYVASHISDLFPNTQLVRQNEMLPGGNIIDLHLRTVNGEDIFIEVKTAPIDKTYLRQLVNYYTAISNMEPPPKSFKIVLIGKKIEPSLKEQIKGMRTEFLSLNEIGSLQKGTQSHQIQLSTTEARLILALESRRMKIVTPADTTRLRAR